MTYGNTRTDAGARVCDGAARLADWLSMAKRERTTERDVPSGMSQWGARCDVCVRLTIKRESGSHRTLSREGWPDHVCLPRRR
jgi:hypothetical protein